MLVVLSRYSTEKNKGYTCVDNLDNMVRFVWLKNRKEGFPQNLQQKSMQVMWKQVLFPLRLGLANLLSAEIYLQNLLSGTVFST